MRKVAPTSAQTAVLEPYAGLSLEQIHVPATPADFAAAAEEIRAAKVAGFDTESKPVFAKGVLSEGPHVMQFSLRGKAFIFQLHRLDCHPFLVDLLQSEEVLKVGFGLASDRRQIHRKLGVEIRALLDLNHVFRKDGYCSTAGVRAAVAIVFNRRFSKSKQVTTSNWAAARLSPQQLLYAANDAHAALSVLDALGRPLADLPITGLSPAGDLPAGQPER